MPHLLPRAIATPLAIALVLITCTEPTAPDIDAVPYGLQLGVASETEEFTIVGAGDIAGCDRLGDEATAALLDRIEGTVVTLGDNAYPDGTAEQYRDCYGASWGRHKERTYASLGNHEYHLGNADASFDYFGDRVGPRDRGWYSFDIGNWHIVVLNTGNSSIVPTAAGSEQERWLRDDLEANTRRCTLAIWHHPRFFSTGDPTASGVSNTSRPFWNALYQHGAELILNGHSHHYERLVRAKPNGTPDSEFGIRQIIVGTGGHSTGMPTSLHSLSEIQGRDFGVIKVTLGVDSYRWEFIPIDGASFTDSGSGDCHDPPPQTEVGVTSSLEPSTYSSAVTLTASVSYLGSIVTVGRVTFIEGGTCANPATVLAGPLSVNSSGLVRLTTSSLSAAGSPHHITACYSGSGDILPAAGKITQTVLKAPAGITLSQLEHTYNGAVKEVVVTTTPDGLGTSTVYSRDGAETLSPIAAGSYAVTSTIVSDNYSGVAVGTMVIAKATQQIVFDPLSPRRYGDPPFVLNAAASSNLPVGYRSSGACRVDGSQLTITDAGECSITAEQLGDANYQSAAPVTHTFEVEAAALTVRVISAQREYGEPNPGFIASYEGFVLDDGPGDLGGALTFTTSADVSSAVGPYDVVPGGLVSDRYDLVYQSGTLTITPAALSILVHDAVRPYGSPNPEFTGEIIGLRAADQIGASYSTPADISSSTGTYTIAPTIVDPNGRIANYSVTVTTGTLTIEKAQQTITFPALPAATFGDPPLDLSGVAEASSLLPLQFTATGDCSITGNLVSMTAAGSCTITAFQDGDANFEAAAHEVQTFTIHKKSVTLTLTGLSGHTYDATAKQATVATDPDGIAGLSVTYDASPTAPVDAGEYVVDVTLENPNYVAPPARGVLTIARRPATVVVANQQRTYGDPNPALTGTIGNLVAADDLSCAYSTPADIAASVGSHTIEAQCAERAGKQNYTVAVTSGTLSVEPAPLSVRADDASMTYGDQIPLLTGAVSGLRNNDPISVSVATAASATSPAGSYSIIPQLVDPEGKAGNYSLSVINGNLTIVRASLTVSAVAATRTYGDPNPAFTVTYDGFRNGDDESILDGTLSFEVNATTESPVGSYLITPLGRSAANYSVMHVAGVLTVIPAPLTVIPDDHERPYGSPNPAFGGNIIGLRNGDEITATYSSSAAESSPAGSYTIEAAIADPSGRLTNYLLTVATGTLTVHKADQTITFDALPDATYGDGPVQLTASSTSTQPVTFSAEGSCTADGTMLTLTSAGMCAVTAQQPGDGNYNAAPEVNRAFAIAKATPVITWDDPEEIPYGVPLGADQLRAIATFRGSPLTGSFVYSPAAGTFLDVGADQELGVTFTPDDQTSFTTALATARIDVRKAAQVISFSPLPDRTFGDAPFTVSASASSGLPVSFAVGPADQCALSGNTVTITGAGSCTVTASQEGSMQYEAAPSVSRTFGIAKASQTLVFGGVPAKTFGDAAFDAAAYATISSGLPVSFTSATPDRCTIQGSQVLITDVGVDASACTITAIQVGNENYEAVTSSTSFDIRNRIDIYPSTSDNSIAWKGSQTQFTVAILTIKNSDGSTIFDASRIDQSTLTMTGPSGTGTVATDNKGNPKVYLRDVDGDRDLDLYVYFYKTDVFTAADVSPTPHVMTWNARLKADTRPVRGFDLLRLDP